MSIIKEVEERVDLCRITWIFSCGTSVEELESEIKEYAYIDHTFNPKFVFFQNNSAIVDGESWNELRSKLVTELWEMDDDLKISLSVNKTVLETLVVFDQKAFVENIPKEPKQRIKFWDDLFIKNKTLKVYNDTFTDISLPSFDKLQAKNLFNDLEISNAVSITPENLYHLVEELEQFDAQTIRKHLQLTVSVFCLKLFCSKYRDFGDVQFIFDGYNSCIFENPDASTLIQTSDNLYTIYQWIFSDSNVSSKLGILRNLVSLTNSKDIGSCFSHNLLKSLFSNYQVYMKDNVKQYFEIKNKVTEFMFDLLNKAIDIQDDYKQASKNTVLAVLSYFFTVIVIRHINKKELETLFSPEVASISIVFIASAAIYIWMGRNELIKKNESISVRVEELKGRYEHVLCQEEATELFNSKSLTNSLKDNANLKIHLWANGILGLLLLCVVFFSISNLGLGFFVDLFT